MSAIANGAQIIDGAGFDMSFDFSERSGSATFSDLLGADVNVSIGSGEGAAFSGFGGAEIMGNPTLVEMRGDFYNGPGGDPARATAGTLDILSSDGQIAGAGIFAGDRVE